MHGTTAPARGARHIRLGAVSLAASALLLAIFPLVRPFGDRSANALATAEAFTSLQIAQTFTSTPWVVAHVLGALGFLLLPIGLYGLYEYLRDSPSQHRAFQGLILSWIGVGLFLPIFGTEAFALRAVGYQAIYENGTRPLVMVNSIRMGPQVGFLVPSLLLLAVGAILTAVAVWESSTLPRWGGVLFALGLVFFFPLFPQVIRIVDGLLIGVGGIWVALSILLCRGSAEAAVAMRR